MLTKIKRIMTSRLFIFAIIILLQLAMITSLVLTLSLIHISTVVRGALWAPAGSALACARIASRCV